MAFSLDRVLKALLFGASGPLSVKDIQAVFTKYHAALEEPEEEGEEPLDKEEPEQPFLPGDGMPTTEVPSLVTSAQIRESMDRIAQGLIDKDEVFRLIERHSGFLLVTSPTVGEWISLLRDEPRPIKLNQSALETLAVIAYRQPVVRAEVEKIRGVSIDSPLSKLMERDFVQVVGRADLPGRPIQYGTTEAFLEFVGIRSIEELPASDVLSPGQLDEWLREASNQKEVTEKEMGLPEGERSDDSDTSPSNDEADAELAEEAEAVAEEESDEDVAITDDESVGITEEEDSDESESDSGVELSDDAEEKPAEASDAFDESTEESEDASEAEKNLG